MRKLKSTYPIHCRSDVIIGLISREVVPNYSHDPWYPFECPAQLQQKLIYYTFS